MTVRPTRLGYSPYGPTLPPEPRGSVVGRAGCTGGRRDCSCGPGASPYLSGSIRLRGSCDRHYAVGRTQGSFDPEASPQTPLLFPPPWKGPVKAPEDGRDPNRDDDRTGSRRAGAEWRGEGHDPGRRGRERCRGVRTSRDAHCPRGSPTTLPGTRVLPDPDH